jgi:hypothetical protein
MDLIDYIEEYSDVIAVREKVNGNWGSYFLNDLKAKDAIKHVCRFIREGRLPVRIKRDSEME